MRVLHFSDNHGQLWVTKYIDLSDVDLVISTGDFFPNWSRGAKQIETRMQPIWLEQNAGIIGDWLCGKPLLSVP